MNARRFIENLEPFSRVREQYFKQFVKMLVPAVNLGASLDQGQSEFVASRVHFIALQNPPGGDYGEYIQGLAGYINTCKGNGIV